MRKARAEAIHERHQGKLLAYSCSPSFNWRKHLSDREIATFQRELGALGYRFQFVTLADFHALNESMFDLARGYAAEGMAAYVRLQEAEFALEEHGYTATRHQGEVGAGYRVADLPLVERLAKSARRTFSGPAVWAPGDARIDELYAQNDHQHRAIRQALAAGSAAGARALAREHVLSSFHMLEEILEQVGARAWRCG